MEPKICLHCGKEIKGRLDKKFCDDQCRTPYNNRLRCENDCVRNVNRILKRNRKVLANLAPEGKRRIKRQRLYDKGYNFSFHTHTYKTRAGSRFTFCYDYGFQALDRDLFLLMKRVLD